ncbi:hypothetical protein GW796_06780 [archaeon]|nr:hypothetical protein [archaeon]
MNKVKQILVTTFLIGMVISANANTSIPDPMVDIISPPTGLPSGQKDFVIQSQNGLNLQGVIIMSESEGKIAQKYNKALMNGGYYKIGDIVSNEWKLTSLNRKMVVLINVKTKEVKKIYISGE